VNKEFIVASTKSIDPKRSQGALLRIDERVFIRLPRIVDSWIHARYRYKFVKHVDATGRLTDLTWCVFHAEWSLQMDALLRRDEIMVTILASPEGEGEVRAIAQILIDNGATWLKGINPSLK